MSHNCFPFTPIIIELNTRLPMSPGCGLWMSESKYQRSRSQCSDYYKWILAHNCFPFTSAIIKLHAQIPCESRICLTDIGVKNLGSLNLLLRGIFVPLGQPHSSLNFRPVLPYGRWSGVFHIWCHVYNFGLNFRPVLPYGRRSGMFHFWCHVYNFGLNFRPVLPYGRWSGVFHIWCHVYNFGLNFRPVLPYGRWSGVFHIWCYVYNFGLNFRPVLPYGRWSGMFHIWCFTIWCLWRPCQVCWL